MQNNGPYPQGGNWPQQPYQQPQNPWANQWGNQQQGYYQTQQNQNYNLPAEMPREEKKSILNQDIPMTYVVLGTLFIWVLMFAGIFGYMATQPCGFVSLTSGDGDTLDQLEQKFNFDLRDNPEHCRQFIQTILMGTEPSSS
jgi:hypothetical protein